MKVEEFTSIMNIVERMKCNTRHSWLSNGRTESVAEHSYRLALMAYFVKDEYPDIDVDKVIKMCLFHDLGEAFTGDIPTFLKTDSDESIENEKINQFINSISEPFKSELKSIFIEMKEQESSESKLYKALDKLEALMQHNEADISTWLPLEYDLQLSYGEKECNFSDYTKKLRKYTNDISLDKIKEDSQ